MVLGVPERIERNHGVSGVSRLVVAREAFLAGESCCPPARLSVRADHNSRAPTRGTPRESQFGLLVKTLSERWTMITIRRIASASLLLLAAGSASADFVASPVEFTLEQTARMVVAKYDLIIEGTVEDATAVPRRFGDKCMWMTELTISSLTPIKGVVRDQVLVVPTLSLPPELPPSPPGGCTYTIAEDVPPPASGDSGIFLLKLHPKYGLMLQTVKYSFLAKKPGNLITVDSRGPKTWPYDEFKEQLRHYADMMAPVASIKDSELILILRPHPSSELETRIEENSKWHYWPADVKKVYRGTITLGRYYIKYSPDDRQDSDNSVESMTRGILGRLLSHQLQSVQGRSIVFFGTLEGKEVLVPKGVCFVSLNNNGDMQFPYLQVANGRADWQTIKLDEIEETLRNEER